MPKYPYETVGNILSFAAAVLLALLLCFRLPLLMIRFFLTKARTMATVQMSAALVLTIVAIPVLFRGIRSG